MDVDLAILGGGPAGTVAAWLAARDGARVALIDPDRTAAQFEGVSPRLLDWLARAGLGDAGAVGAIRAQRRSHWTGAGFEGNQEWIVDRARLDGHLRQMVRAAGVEMLRDTGRPEAGGVLLSSGAWIAAGMVLDARGRRGSGQKRRRGPATIAIGQSFRQIQPTPPMTVIEAIPQGWVWCACPGNGLAWVQFTTDAADPVGTPPAQRLQDALAAAADRLPALGAAQGDILLREAAPVLPALLTDLSVIPIGDALAAMDPLSGHGMFWAVSSALVATAIRRTLMHDPAAGDLALRFLNQRAGETYLRQARLGRDFIAAETRFADRPFWAARRVFPDSLPLNDGVNLPRIARRVVVDGNRLVKREVLLTRHSPGGVGWLSGQSAAALYRAHIGHATPSEMERRFGPVGRIFAGWLAAQMHGVPEPIMPSE
ncbi:MAG: FAD-dependent oxidoreductase [Paracoccus sp. (in: a-proteobacteria)]|nr:FAD-dependent oxidoreductase [Paracoccus sp. (in: a-proteobacteria)]